MLELNGKYEHKDGGVYRTLTLHDVCSYDGVTIKTVMYESIDTGKRYVRTVEHFNDSFKLVDGTDIKEVDVKSIKIANIFLTPLEAANLLFKQIEHGDNKHRTWLKNALNNFFLTSKVNNGKDNSKK